MADQLLVRCYKVGLGDCIYLRIPDGNGGGDGGIHRHVLIDCGNKFGTSDDLREAMGHLADELPKGDDGRPRLDLLVVSHPHEDHLRGIDVETFGGLEIGEIWLSPCMDPDHPQRQDIKNVQRFADETLMRLRDEGPSLALRNLARDLLELSKADALEALFKGLPDVNPELETRYVSADTPAKDLDFFDDDRIRLRVLSPMDDIDRYYLGRLPQELQALRAAAGHDDPRDAHPGATLRGETSAVPKNIGRGDFERLRGRMLENALAFTLKSSHLINNLSVVLLLEWRGRRLLFPGDAEVQLTRKGKFEDGKRNGAWNVMWETQREHLDAAVDFLKVGHHGSHNATPWTTKKVRVDGEQKPHPVNEILNAILPEPTPGKVPRGHAVVSTRRTRNFEKIPEPKLMGELGRRVQNVETYREEPVKGVAVAGDVRQPWRTDLDPGPDGFVELTFDPLDP